MKFYSYHRLYTGSDLIADIGGYLGLFLGLSVFGLVELIEKAIKENKNNEGGLRATLSKKITLDRTNLEQNVN